jgi:hypothetical protein
MMEFNINEYVHVKLTDTGRLIHQQDHATFVAAVPTLSDGMKVYRPPREDAAGWSKFQGWRLMQLFGPHMHLGGNNPFDLTVRFEGKHLNPVADTGVKG